MNKLALYKKGMFTHLNETVDVLYLVTYMYVNVSYASCNAELMALCVYTRVTFFML